MVSKEIKREEFIRMYRELSLADFLKNVGISASTLYRILENEGIPRNRKHGPSTKIKLI